MNSLFRFKGKLFHFINVLIYFIVFIFGYLCGSIKIKLFNFFQIDNVFAAYGDYTYTYNNYANFYLFESPGEWSLGHGFVNPRSYNEFVSFNQVLENHHVYNYLEQVTRYLTDNYSGDYEFTVAYFNYSNYQRNYLYTNLLQTYNNYLNNAYGSYIIVWYYPKGSIERFNIVNQLPLFNCSSSRCSTDVSSSYIPGSGYDIIPISYVNGSDVRWYLDNVWSQYNGINIVDYLLYRPVFLNYKSILQDTLSNNQFWNNVISYDNGVYSNDISAMRDRFNQAINDRRFIFPYFDFSYYIPGTDYLHYENPSASGFMFYYSSVPVFNNTLPGVTSYGTNFIIGSYKFVPGDEIPTYASARGLEFANLHNYTDISDFFNYQDYRVVCSQSQVLMINSYGSYNPVSVFIPEDWQSNDNFVTYDFYSYDVNTGVNSKLTSNNSNFYATYLSSSSLNSMGLPDFLDGFTMIDFIPNGLDNFIISRSDFNTDTYNLNSLIPTPSQSHSYDNNYFNYYDPVTGLNHDDNNISLVQPPTKDGNWCVYVLQDNIVESLYVNNADIYRSLPNNPNGLNKQDISFSGIFLDENGNPHTFEYINPLYSVGDSVWSYSDNFVSSNKNTLTFIGSLSSYFFDNVHSSFFMFCVVALIILIFIKILNFYNGGDR